MRWSRGRSRALSRGTIAKLGIKPGDPVRVSTRRGVVELAARQDDAVPDGVVFIPFAYVEAAANLLTNPELDPFGKIPEFKFCAAKVEAVDPASAGRGGVGRHFFITAIATGDPSSRGGEGDSQRVDGACEESAHPTSS